MLFVRAVWMLSALAIVVVPGSQGGRPVAAALGPTVASDSPSGAPSLTPAAELAFAPPTPFSSDDRRPGAAPDRDQPSTAQTALPPRPPQVTLTGRDPRPGTARAVLAAAYRSAARTVTPRCHLRVWHLAAIGQLESGSIGGRTVVGHRVSPAIYGPLLDGGPFAVVTDSDGGRVDGAGDYDRAVGPLQFLPGTWRWAGRDGDADGVRDPQNVFDAAAATAGYLCRDGRDLARGGDLRGAFWSYNQSAEYVSAAVEWASFFQRNGLAAMDDVAFRVGSGGRASALATTPEDDGAAAPTWSSTTSAAGPAAPTTTSATAGAVPSPSSTPTSSSSPTPTPTPTQTLTPEPTPDPTPEPTQTLPSDDPSDPAPQPSEPADALPAPSAT